MPFMRSERELILASKEFAVESPVRSWLELLITLAALAGTLSLIFLIDSILVRIPLSVLCGLLYVRLFVIYHDYRHRAILKNSGLATILMKFIGLWVLAPEQIWNRSHEHHHNNNSKLTMSGIGSYPTISKTRFNTLTPQQRTLYLINRHPLTILVGYLTLFIYWLNLKSFMESPRRHFDSLGSLLLHGSAIALIWIYAGLATALLAWIVPFFIMSAMGAYLFYCQHNFPGARFAEGQQWSYINAALQSTSFMVMSPVMRWFTASIGFHHVHHLNSRIPFYRLEEALHTMPELHGAGTTSWNPLEVYRCLRLKVWDEEKGELTPL